MGCEGSDETPAVILLDDAVALTFVPVVITPARAMFPAHVRLHLYHMVGRPSVGLRKRAVISASRALTTFDATTALMSGSNPVVLINLDYVWVTSSVASLTPEATLGG
jgi:hypothetical protein